MALFESKQTNYLHFRSSQLSKKYFSHELSKQEHKHESLNVQHLVISTQIRLMGTKYDGDFTEYNGKLLLFV